MKLDQSARIRENLRRRGVGWSPAGFCNQCATPSTHFWVVHGRFLRARTPSCRFSSHASPPPAFPVPRAGQFVLARPPEWREDKLSRLSAPRIAFRGPPLCPKEIRSRTPASHLWNGIFIYDIVRATVGNFFVKIWPYTWSIPSKNFPNLSTFSRFFS